MTWYIKDINGNILGTVYAPNAETADNRAGLMYPEEYSYIEER